MFKTNNTHYSWKKNTNEAKEERSIRKLTYTIANAAVEIR